jgi:ankyrin repeat protein
MTLQTIEDYDREYTKKILRDPAANDNHGIKWACENGYIDLVRTLLQDSRVNPGANYNIALFWAAFRGYNDIIKLLLQDSRVKKSEAINRAKKDNFPHVIETLSQF